MATECFQKRHIVVVVVGVVVVKVTRSSVLPGTVPFFNLLSWCPKRFHWDASLSHVFENWNLFSIFVHVIFLTLIVPRGWEIGSKQPCIKCQKNSAAHFVYFWSCKTPPIHIWNNLHKLQKQGQSLHIWMTSPSTTDCYKNKYIIQFCHCHVLADRLAAILSGETELALCTVRVKTYF